MKVIVAAIVIFILSSTWAFAESSVWKAQKGDSVIYLGGTFHVLRESDFPLPPEFDKAYRSSQILVFETDIGKLQDPATQQKMLSKAIYADGTTVDKHVSAATFRELKAYCASRAIPLESLNRFKPAMLMTTLTVMELMKLGVTQHGVDQYFYDLARQDKKMIIGLETVDEQIEHVMSMADGSEDRFISYSIQEMQRLKQAFEDMSDAWRRGDAARLDELVVAEMKTKLPQFYKKLITNRNDNWLRQMDALEKNRKATFVLVGAAHLVGPEGLLAALKKRGYRIEQLKAS